ncbi:MAG: hypothetical protein ACT4PV_07860 [Planctomycetaceae bacterium]
MLRICLLLPAAALLVACSHRYKPAEKGDDVEGRSLVTLHPDLSGHVHLVKHSAARTADGRLHVRVVLSSNRRGDLALIGRTEWLDENRDNVGNGEWRHFMLPSGTTAIYESSSLDTRAVGYSVAVRPASSNR